MDKTHLMTIVIPAYNEAHRLPQTLREVIAFVEASAEALNVLVVNNNSRDQTGAIAQAAAKEHACLRVIDQPIQGKGAAVRKGMFEADGRYVFVCDADLAMPIDSLPLFYPEHRGQEYDIAIGSREAPGARRYNEPVYRHLMGRVFNLMVRLLAVPGIQDTQCGFKAFKRDVGQRIFAIQRINGFAFDVEVLAIAQRWGVRVIEVGIPWYYGEHGSVSPLRDAYRMFREVLHIRHNVRTGRYDAPGVSNV